MKTLLLVLLAGSRLLACKEEEPTSAAQAAIGQPFNLAAKQTITLPAGGSPVRITLKEVNDSRCPTGVQCVWAGYAAVEVELTDASASPQTASISLHFNRAPKYTADSVGVTLNQKPYTLYLLNVNPYPTGTNTDQAKIATLRLRAR